MYSIVMLAAMTAGPDVPQDLMCHVTPSKYGHKFWSKNNFYDCCAPAHYGWVNCWNKGFSYYPGGGRGFGGHCGSSPSYGQFYHPGACACSCAPNYGAGGGFGGGCTFCGHGWSVGNKPAYYTSVLGCPPHVSSAPYANYTEKNPCCKYGNFAFDSGLIGHSHGVGYAGFGGYGNFGHYGGASMMHKPTTNDLPPFPNPEYRLPSAVPSTPAPMPPLPTGKIIPPSAAPDSAIPKIPELPAAPAPIPEPPKKSQSGRPSPATIVLCVPERAVVTVEGQTLQSTGRERTFRTPILAPAEDFVYMVQATVIVDGKAETETLKVNVWAGQISRASFEKLFAKVDRPVPDVTTASAGR